MKDYVWGIAVCILFCVIFYMIGFHSAKRVYEPIIKDQEEIIAGYEKLKMEKVEIQDGVIEVRMSFQKMQEEMSHFRYWAEIFKQIMAEEEEKKKTKSMKTDRVNEED